ncbi:MAG: glycosyltransferase family 2 protein [Peptoanaerobacter stomatis]|uniref:glycosyltransferase family 2 protein n=1 Tax=Peptoanaerobacter stomatis TaxID=796937 RepID=UPI003FA0210D
MSRISVVLPVYNSWENLRDTIDSIINQTYTDWEIIIINEYGSNEIVEKIVSTYKNNKIIFIQNDTRLGLSESLNKGIRLSSGEYIARIDSGDISYRNRFRKQVDLLEQNDSIGVCGTYQRHKGKRVNWVHKTPISKEDCKAALLFDCELCHSTVMFKKDIFEKNNLYYDKKYYAEDFELWSRVVEFTNIVNIPEELGLYRVGDNITDKKKENIISESVRIVKKSLKKYLEIDVSDRYDDYIKNWTNPFKNERNLNIRKKMYLEYIELLTNIYKKNLDIGFYNENSLKKIINLKWKNMKYREPKDFTKGFEREFEYIFKKNYIPNFFNIIYFYYSHNKII